MTKRLNMEQYLDTELVAMAQKGEAAAFDELVSRYQRKVAHLAFRYVRNNDVAMDLVQDIFFKIFRNLHNFKGESKFSSWLFRIAVNDCIDHTRRVKVRKEQSLNHIQEYGFDVVDQNAEAEVSAFEVEDERRRVRQALADLPESQRTVVVMKIYQDMTFDEISEILETPVSTLKSRLYKALDNIGSKLRRADVIREVTL